MMMHHDDAMLGPLGAILGPLGTSGACFAVRRFVSFQRSGESECIAAEGRHFPALAFLCEFRFFQKMAASPAKASVSPQRGDIFGDRIIF